MKRKKLKLLLDHEISLFAYHLPLDFHPQLGNNWKAAMDLGWSNLEPFGFMNGISMGVKGKISATPREEVKQQLEKYYQHKAVCALGGPTLIKSLALISGGAHKSISEAIKEEVDAYITGSFDEPVWHQVFEEKINFFALGHAATERVGPIELARHLKEKLQLPCAFIDTDNPF